VEQKIHYTDSNFTSGTGPFNSSAHLGSWNKFSTVSMTVLTKTGISASDVRYVHDGHWRPRKINLQYDLYTLRFVQYAIYVFMCMSWWPECIFEINYH
jgi:hypothetical protein